MDSNVGIHDALKGSGLFDSLLSPEFAVLIPLLGGIIAYLAGKAHYRARDAVSVAFAVITVLVVFLLKEVDASWQYTMYEELGVSIGFETTLLGWFFACIVAFLALLSYIYGLSYTPDASWQNRSHLLIAVFTASMLGIVFASDLLTLFILWEAMTVSSFMLVRVKGSDPDRSAYRYLMMGIASSYFILMGMVLIWARFGTLVFADLSPLMSTGAVLSGQETLLLVALFIIGFGTKSALLPFHVWAPGAYKDSENTFTAYFSGAGSKMGIFGLMIIFYKLLTTGNPDLTYLGELKGVPLMMWSLSLFGAATAMVATLAAIVQDDLKKLLAYSSIAQLGYIFVGLGIGDGVGTAGALFHTLNHALFKSVLFFGCGWIILMTGTSKIHELGGAASKMPLTFLPVLFAIFAVAAIPITSGFISKWIIYQAGLNRGFILLVPMMFIAGVGSFLYLFRILHPVFLGQVHKRDKELKDAPAPVLVVLWFLAFLIIIFALFPVYVLDVIRNIQVTELGFSNDPASAAYVGWETTDMWRMDILNSNGAIFGTWNALAVFMVFAACFGAVFILWIRSGKLKQVGLRDSYMAGEEIPTDMNIHVAWMFYGPLELVIVPWLREVSTWIFRLWSRFLHFLGGLADRVYNGSARAYSAYLLVFLVVFMTVMGTDLGWWSP